MATAWDTIINDEIFNYLLCGRVLAAEPEALATLSKPRAIALHAICSSRAIGTFVADRTAAAKVVQMVFSC
jgi:hypothetical protein